MDVNSENIDWMIFELLEGNLNPQETKDLLIIIQGNPEWKSLLEAYEQTYLKEEYIEFPHKDAIYKSSKLKISWLQKSVAAAIILILISTGWYLKIDSNNSLTPEVVSLKNIKPTSPEPLPSKVGQEVIKEIPTPNKSIVIQNSNPPKLHSKPKKTTAMDTIERLDREKKEYQDSIQMLVLAERDFWQQMLLNKYLSDQEKIEKLIKWRNINRGSSNTTPTEEVNALSQSEDPDIQMIFTNNNDLSNKSDQTTERWIKNQIDQMKNFRVPAVKVSTRKRENSAIPGITIKLKMQNQ